MMKKYILLLCLLCSSVVLTYSQQDSVRVRLSTSPVAVIGIDGDVSSTNLLAKHVLYGKHIVTVQYGNNITKEYEINVVKGGQTDFQFSIDGKLTISSNYPKAIVSIDGVPQESMPLEINLVGTHKIYVDGRDDYFDQSDRVTVPPFENVQREYILQKRPPKLYGFIIANYMPVEGSFGLMGGLGRKFGVYAKLNISTTNDEVNGSFPHLLYPGGYSDDKQYNGANVGLIWRANKFMALYIGSGYGEYLHGRINDNFFYTDKYHYHYYNSKNFCFSTSGLELDLGFMLKWKALLLQAGYTRIMKKSDNGCTFGAFNIGIGITIHKNKKG